MRKHPINRKFQLSQDGFSVVELVMVLVFVGVLGFVGFRVIQNMSDKNSLEYPKTEVTTNDNGRAVIPEDCRDKSLEFTHDIVKPADRTNFNQAGGFGGVNPPHHTIPSGHGYVGLVDKSYRMPLYAPATANLIRVSKTTQGENQTTAAMYFAICGDIPNGISFHFGHISEVAPEIASRIDCEGETCEWESEPNEPVEIEAGTLIAYVGGPYHDSANVDFGVKDTTNAFDLPGGYEVWRERVHSNCPFDYFQNEQTKAYYFMLLDVNMEREPKCGTMQLNVKDTAQGYWFDPATPWPTEGRNEGNHLTFGLETSNAKREFMATGGLVSAGGWYESTNSGQVNRASSQITADGNKYCIESIYSHSVTNDRAPGIVIFQMTKPVELKAEHLSSDRCPININDFNFTSESKTFERFKKGWKHTENF